MTSKFPLDPRSAAAAQVRAALQARERALRGEVEAVIERGRGNPARESHEVVDPEEVAGDQVAAGIGDAEMERDVAELREIGDAMHRLDEGRYGLCKDCDESIDPLRLEAEPFAVRCAPCQTRLEQARQRRG